MFVLYIHILASVYGLNVCIVFIARGLVVVCDHTSVVLRRGILAVSDSQEAPSKGQASRRELTLHLLDFGTSGRLLRDGYHRY